MFFNRTDEVREIEERTGHCIEDFMDDSYFQRRAAAMGYDLEEQDEEVDEDDEGTL